VKVKSAQAALVLLCYSGAAGADYLTPCRKPKEKAGSLVRNWLERERASDSIRSRERGDLESAQPVQSQPWLMRHESVFCAKLAHGHPPRRLTRCSSFVQCRSVFLVCVRKVQKCVFFGLILSAAASQYHFQFPVLS
jgi:hypothetical protein